MIAIIRIHGQVNINEKFAETLNRLHLRRKFSCTVIHETPEMLGMLRKIENFVAYGKISRETLTKLVEKRGQPIAKGRKIDAGKIAEEFEKNKPFKELGVKPFFRLHPPHGGLKTSRLHYPRGVLGNHKEKINKLIERML